MATFFVNPDERSLEINRTKPAWTSSKTPPVHGRDRQAACRAATTFHNSPRVTGGNIDCKELVEGSALYLPIAVQGRLFSTGDDHALQGDGEASRTAIECPMEKAQLKFNLFSEMHITNPRAETPAGFV